MGTSDNAGERANDVAASGQVNDIADGQEGTVLAEEEQGGVMHRWHFPHLDAELWLPEAVFAEMRRLAGEALPCESGGTLVGHYLHAGRVAQVERGLGVRRGARHGRTSFYRPPDEIDGQLAEIYHASGGRTYYLGEWHSHPGSTPGPSLTDLRTAHELARSPMVATDTPILLILEGDVRTSPMLRCLVVDAAGQVIHGSYVRTASQILEVSEEEVSEDLDLERPQ